jgi:hypothetical protein
MNKIKIVYQVLQYGSEAKGVFFVTSTGKAVAINGLGSEGNASQVARKLCEYAYPNAWPWFPAICGFTSDVCKRQFDNIACDFYASGGDSFPTEKVAKHLGLRKGKT